MCVGLQPGHIAKHLTRGGPTPAPGLEEGEKKWLKLIGFHRS